MGLQRGERRLVRRWKSKYFIFSGPCRDNGTSHVFPTTPCPYSCKYLWRELYSQNRHFIQSLGSYVCVCMLSHVQLFVTPWTVAHQSFLSMGFPRQEYWSGLPFPLPGDLSDLGIKPVSPALADGFFTTEPPRKPEGS